MSSAFDATPFGWGRGSIVAPTLVPPAPTAQIGVLDTYVDDTHPDLAGHVQHLPGPAAGVTHPHGTMVSSAAAGAYNGFGVTGIFPGAQIVNYGVTEELRCSDSVNGITALAAARVAVIVASYGFTEPCYAEYHAIALAYGVGTMVVAAAGQRVRGRQPGQLPGRLAARPVRRRDETRGTGRRTSPARTRRSTSPRRARTSRWRSRAPSTPPTGRRTA